jgi:glycosyltransferase involved in cell wall biosynthesis
MKPLVSILVPAYNAEAWIEETLNSALRQTWSPKEIVVVDDGSTDKTLSMAQKFSNKGVRVLSQKNRGASAARNHAFSACHGDYIQWLDADDILAPDKIARQMEFAVSSGNKSLLLSSEWGRFLYRAKRAEFTPTELWNDLSPLEWLIHKMSKNIWMQPGSWLVSRELTEAAGPWDVRLTFDDDGEYFCRVLLKSQGVKFIRGAKIFYRVNNPASLSSFDHSDKKRESVWLSIRLHIKYLLQLEDSERTRQAALAFLQTWLPALERQRPDIVEQVEELASLLGGHVNFVESAEVLRWKFAWVQNVLGRRAAFWAQDRFPQFKHSMIRFWDKTIYRLEKFTQPEL